MRRTDEVGTAAGLIAPALFAVVVTALTLRERAFLNASGWSPLHKSRVEWPSLLALGPSGWLLTATFVVCGALGLLFALTLYRRLQVAPAAALVAVIAFAVALEAFAADAPTQAGAESWHARLHNAVYPAIPAAAVAAAAVLGTLLRRRPAQRRLAQLSLAAASLMAVAAVSALFDDVAQLARFVLFGALLVWLELIAFACRRRAEAVASAGRRRAG